MNARKHWRQTRSAANERNKPTTANLRNRRHIQTFCYQSGIEFRCTGREHWAERAIRAMRRTSSAVAAAAAA